MQHPVTPSLSVDPSRYWLAIKTFFAQEKKVSNYLESAHVDHFLPMVTRKTVDAEGNTRLTRQIAVHNLLFVPIEHEPEVLKDIFDRCPYAIYVYRRPGFNHEWIKIPDRDMVDLRLICDNSFNEPKFLSARECNMKIGQEVLVIHGPLKNIVGKLIRKNKKYYLVRTIGDWGVVVNVSRWCCKPLEDGE